MVQIHLRTVVWRARLVTPAQLMQRVRQYRLTHTEMTLLDRVTETYELQRIAGLNHVDLDELLDVDRLLESSEKDSSVV